MKKLLVTALAASTALANAAFADDAELRAEAKGYFEAIPLQAPMLEGNVLSRDRIELGKKLFFDPRMSRSGLFSCQSCHNVGIGGVDGLETSIGHGWQKGPRNAPTMLNAVFNVAQFWDGRAPDLAEQAKGPLQASVEMNNTPENLLATLNSMQPYVDEFKTSFPGEEDPVSFDNFAKAIEAFEATLITPNSAFDKFLMGQDAAMTDQEKRGLALFMDEGCAACHQGINVGGQDYYPFGLVEKPGADVLPEGDHGRFAVTETADDEYVFRAGPLRNIALTAPYFHSGTVWELRDAVAIMVDSQLGSDLSDEQIDDITAFLGALTGEQPEIVHPILPARTKATPKPYTMLTEQ
ncbi:cytochrome-c peroxidase [Thioclava indica]|uniref:Cytochrome C biogenesis protein CcsA n=1 Tax=Thioclava indica TaxID=1353528 RepID=A0A074JW04_9RHOB|nr:cytochrome-c peroxidase [Thioclava indica]KEO60624.1 cytochrome C biogenesis protein CcsA [Thioclava indica]